MNKQIRIGLMDTRVVVDNRDINTTELHVDGVTITVTRKYLEDIYQLTDVGHVVRANHIDIPLSDADIRYLLENMNENNPLTLDWLELDLVRTVLRYVHTRCVDDNSDIGYMVETLRCSEGELFEAFEGVANKLGIDLNE